MTQKLEKGHALEIGRTDRLERPFRSADVPYSQSPPPERLLNAQSNGFFNGTRGFLSHSMSDHL